MEDFSTLIWIVVILAATIASRGRKARARSAAPPDEKADRPADTASNPTPSGWPAWPQIPGLPDFSTSEEPAPRKAPVSRPAVEHRAQTEQGRHIDTRKKSASPRMVQPGTAANIGKTTKPPRQSDTPTPSPKLEKCTPGQNEASGAEIAADFDLRRAVIYSEILKPKFDE